MNHVEIVNINRKIRQYDILQEAFYISGFLIQPYLFHLSVPERPNRVSAHMHSTYEISTIIRGKFTYIFDSKEYTLNTGDVIIIPPHVKHRWDIPKEEPLISSFMCFISFTGDASKKKMLAFDNTVGKRGYSFKKFKSYSNIINNIISILRNADSITFEENEMEFLIELSYVKLFQELLPEWSDAKRRSASIDFDSSSEKLSELMKYYIYDNITKKILLTELGKYFGVSVSHLNRIFISETGMSVGKFITETRIDLAKRFLKRSNSHIKVIAQKCGYDDFNYFCRRFKKEIGMTPSHYREKSQSSLSC